MNRITGDDATDDALTILDRLMEKASDNYDSGFEAFEILHGAYFHLVTKAREER